MERRNPKRALNTELSSAHYFLGPGDVDKFRPGRPKVDVLKDVQWRGDFGMACEYKGNSVYAITYDFVLQQPRDTMNAEGEWLHAIFEDDKFVKFVRPPEPNAEDMEEVPYEGTTWSRPKPITVGDLSWFIRALASEPVNIAELEKELKTRPEAPSHIDPGLTIAYLLLRATVLQGSKVIATEEDYKRNAELRDQFNAARLKLGMTEQQVEAVLKAKPLEVGKVEADTYRIYGSNEWFSIDPALHFSNILVLFREGKAAVIRSVDAGEGWRQKLEESFIDLPRPVVLPGK